MEDEKVISLIQSWQNDRNQDAVSDLYKMYRGNINYLINSSHAKGLDSESLANEAFFKAINSYSIEVGAKFSTLLSVSFKNLCISARRRRWVTKNIPEKWDEEEKVTLLEIEKRELRKVIAKLPPRESELLTLYLEGNSWNEIRLKFGWPKPTMAGRFNKALRELKKQYV